MDQTDGKKLIIGIDEAGYGPNLGPLLIGGSAWLVPSGMSESELAGVLGEHFAARPWFAGCEHIPLGDSKKLYRAGSGLATLEIGLLSLLSTLGQPPANLHRLLQLLDPHGLANRPALPWYAELDQLPVPARQPCTAAEQSRLGEVAKSALQRCGVQLVQLAATVIFEPQFNHQVARWGSKAQVLAEATLGLATRLLNACPDQPAELFCDRLGGRTNYLPLLLDWNPDGWFQELQRSTQRCSYQSLTDRPLLIHFTVGGDRFPPTALASMTAKYLREQLMASFNDYWRRLQPSLQPTAGYPVDAARFRSEIAALAEAQSLPEEYWWRSR